MDEYMDREFIACVVIHSIRLMCVVYLCLQQQPLSLLPSLYPLSDLTNLIHNLLRPHHLDKAIGNQTVSKGTNPQRQDIQRPVRIQIIQSEDLLAVLDRTQSIRKPLSLRACEMLAPHRVRREIPDRIFDWRDVVDPLQDLVDVETHHAAEDGGDGK